jgi:uncharacterized membrane protein
VSDQRKVIHWIPAALIGLATVLLCVGIILFYAANWRKMPPSFKLVQVFLLIIGLYAASYYVLALKKGMDLLGRAFLMMAMVSFGAGIALVAQIFHISAHPSNGVLVWSIGVFATSWVMRERWGAYLAMLLFLIWNIWELVVYQNPNYLFLPLAVGLMYLFVVLKERLGLVFCVLLLLFWYYQVNAEHLLRILESNSRLDYSGFAFLLMQLPFGIFLVMMGRWLESFPLWRWSSRTLAFFGWLAAFSPLIGMSWPLDWGEPFIFANRHFMAFTVQYLAFCAATGGLMYLLNRRGERHHAAELALLLACPLLLLPLGHKTVLVIAMHLSLLIFLFGLLYFSHRQEGSRLLERIVAISLTGIALVTKFAIFAAMGVASSRYFVAYLLGFVIFGLVCFLSNQIIKLSLAEQQIPYTGTILNVLCALLAYFSFYALSFKLSSQNSIFQADKVVLVMLFLFMGLALLLFAYLWLISSNKLTIALAGVIFFCTAVMMLLTGPNITWNVYSLIFNTMLFVMVATLIYYGVVINSKWLVNFAIMGFLLQIITRYFDVLWELLSGSMLFIITGLLVLLGGYLLEKSRRKLLNHIQQAPTVIGGEQ